MVNHETIEEKDLSILYLRRGIPEAFKLLFFEHYPEFFSFSLMLMQHRLAAQKVTMEVFFLLWERRRELDSGKKIKAFLYLNLRTKCLQELKAPSAGPQDAPAEPVVVPSSLPEDILEDIFDYAARTL